MPSERILISAAQGSVLSHKDNRANLFFYDIKLERSIIQRSRVIYVVCCRYVEDKKKTISEPDVGAAALADGEYIRH